MGAAQRRKAEMIAMKKSAQTVCCLILCAGVLSPVVARAEEKQTTAALLNELADVKARLANIEKQQQDIVAKDNLILEKLDQLRVWVHRK